MYPFPRASSFPAALGVLSGGLNQRTRRDDEPSGLAPCGPHFRLYRPISSTLTTIRP
jgi:hypothetical protein